MLLVGRQLRVVADPLAAVAFVLHSGLGLGRAHPRLLAFLSRLFRRLDFLQLHQRLLESPHPLARRPASSQIARAG